MSSLVGVDVVVSSASDESMVDLVGAMLVAMNVYTVECDGDVGDGNVKFECESYHNTKHLHDSSYEETFEKDKVSVVVTEIAVDGLVSVASKDTSIWLDEPESAGTYLYTGLNTYDVDVPT